MAFFPRLEPIVPDVGEVLAGYDLGGRARVYIVLCAARKWGSERSFSGRMWGIGVSRPGPEVRHGRPEVPLGAVRFKACAFRWRVSVFFSIQLTFAGILVIPQHGKR